MLIAESYYIRHCSNYAHLLSSRSWKSFDPQAYYTLLRLPGLIDKDLERTW